jgi:hypothetical protein
MKAWRTSLVNESFIMINKCGLFAPFPRIWRRSFRTQLAAALTLASVGLPPVSSCSRKPGIETSISQLEKAFRATASPEQAAPGHPSRTDANACVLVALAAARTNDYATAVVMLNGAARLPGVTPDQFLAVQQAKNALVADLQNRAERGDTGAAAALKSIQQSRSH